MLGAGADGSDSGGVGDVDARQQPLSRRGIGNVAIHR